MLTRAVAALTGALLMLSPLSVLAQQNVDQREEVNKGTVGIISGGVNGTYIRIASDLASVLDSGNDMRILPIRGKGSVQNITDILFLRGIDIGIVQSDVLEFAKREEIIPSITDRIHYITKLYNEEVHILARADIAGIEDLVGQPVNLGIAGSGTAMTSSIIFDSLGLSVDEKFFDQDRALEMLKSGEIAAQVFVAGKPTSVFNTLTSEDGLHFVAIPLSPLLLETYLPSRLTSVEYPNLVKPDSPVDTVAVGAVMAVYNWDNESYRYRKVERFIDAFFSRFEEFQEAPRHPKWQEVSLTAQVPGWNRFAAADQWLATKTTDAPVKQEFGAFLAEGSIDPASLTDADKSALFQDFLEWRVNNNQ